MSRARELSRLGNINVLSGDDINSEVGIASTVPRSTLDVRGEMKVGTAIQAGTAGVLTATSFSGALGGNIVAAACTFTTGTFTGNVTIGGTLTYEDVTNIDSLGIVTARAGVNVSGGQLQVGVAYSVGAAGVATAAGFVGPLTGAVTGTTGSFSSNLTVGSGITMGSAGVATFSGTSDVHLHDTVKLLIGDSSDLQIHHNGTDSNILGSYGDLYIQNTGSDADDINIRAQDDINLQVQNGEAGINIIGNGAVELYHDNTKKLETTSGGIQVTGNDGVTIVGAQDNSADLFFNADGGDDNDDKWYLGAYAGGPFKLLNYASGSWETNIEANGNGNVELYFNDSKKLETTNDGVNVTGIVTATSKVQINTPTIRENDNIPLLVKAIKRAVPAIAVQGENANGWTVLSDAYVDGESQFSIGLQYSGSGLFIGQKVGVNTTTNDEYVSIQDDHAFRPAGIVIDNGDVKIRNDHVSGVRPVGAAVTMYDRVLFDSTGDIDIYGTAAGITSAKWDASANAFYFKDNSKAYFGDSSDFSIYHDSSNSHLHNTTGTLRIRGDSVKINNAAANKNAIVCESDIVTLYYDNSAKLATTNDGAVITGIATVTHGLNTAGLLSEEFNTLAGQMKDNPNIDLQDGMIWYFTTQETATATPNIRYNASKTLNNMMSTGDAITVTIITTAGSNGYSANWQIDGSNITEEWIGGEAPSEGGSDGYDIYTANILKTGNAAFKVFINLVNAT